MEEYIRILLSIAERTNQHLSHEDIDAIAAECDSSVSAVTELLDDIKSEAFPRRGASYLNE